MKYRINSHWDFLLNKLDGKKSNSKKELEVEIKNYLKWIGNLNPVKTKWDDGTIAFYNSTSDLRRDLDGSSCRATIERNDKYEY